MGAKTKLGLILLLGLGLRLVNINQSLWLDEASQAQMSSLSLSAIWANRAGDFHPPLFYFITHFWLLFSKSETWLRLLPVTFGVLNIYAVYLLARHLFPKFALLSAFLLAIAPYHIYYSQEFRSYSLLCLLGTVSMYYLLRGRYTWLALTNVLLLYTHYSSIFLILTQFLIRPQSSAYFLITIALYLPWLPQFWRQFQAGTNIDAVLPGWRSVLSIDPLKTFPVTIFKLVAGRISFLGRYLYGLYIVFVFAVTFAAAFLARQHARFLLLWVFVPIFIMMAVSFALPQSQPFRVIFVLPALILLFVQAVGRFPKVFLTLLIYIAIVGNVAYFTRPRLQREQWRQAAAFLSAQASPVIVKFPAAFTPLDWYAPDLAIIPALPKLPPLSAPRLFLMEYLTGITDPTRKIDAQLQSLGYAESKIHNFEGVGFIYEFTRTSPPK